MDGPLEFACKTLTLRGLSGQPMSLKPPPCFRPRFAPLTAAAAPRLGVMLARIGSGPKSRVIKILSHS